MANSQSGESVLERCVRVLETFDVDTPERTVAGIARAAKLPTSTTYRIVADMVACGFLDRTPNKTLVIGRRAWELVTRTNRVEKLRFRAQPVMAGIHSVVQQFVSLAVPQYADREVLFVDNVGRSADDNILAKQAGRMALFDNSSGVVLLAHAPKDVREEVLRGSLVSPTTGEEFSLAVLRQQLAFVRQHGYIKIVGGMVAGNTAYAVPLLGPGREVIAALSVVGRSDAVDDRVILSVLAAAGTTLSQGELPLRIPGLIERSF
ncbi:IclR family transcriptional regulator [Corynebacterium vitaeruminis]|uniref:IclR family transcriptional regulator n=1 Tax=Corynebacterium vitaeruminis TaxID=38305 RepID=UPI0028A69EAC|nr:helix-turn-helix domain-containing protein [Corynebacterium vitaeruminis]